MSTLKIQLLCRLSTDFQELAIFAFRPGAMIHLHWPEIPIARTIFHGPKGVRAIKVRLYMENESKCEKKDYYVLLFEDPNQDRRTLLTE